MTLDRDENEFYEEMEKKIKELDATLDQAIDHILTMRENIASMLLELSSCYDLSILSSYLVNQELQEQILNNVLKNAEEEELASI